MFEILRFDLTQVFRGLQKRRLYAAVCAGTLAVVLGAMSALLAVMDVAFVGALPVKGGAAAVNVYLLPPGLSAAKDRNGLYPIDLLELRRQMRTLQRLEGFHLLERVGQSGAEVEVVKTGAISAGLFEMLTAHPVLGRAFTVDEDENRAPVAVISFGYWMRHFGGSAQAIGRSIELDRIAYTIVGVMPATFPPGVPGCRGVDAAQHYRTHTARGHGQCVSEYDRYTRPRSGLAPGRRGTARGHAPDCRAIPADPRRLEWRRPAVPGMAIR